MRTLKFFFATGLWEQNSLHLQRFLIILLGLDFGDNSTDIGGSVLFIARVHDILVFSELIHKCSKYGSLLHSHTKIE